VEPDDWNNPDDHHVRIRRLVDENLARLSLIDSWSRDEHAAIRRWLKANAATLDDLAHATMLEHCWHESPENGARLYDRITMPPWRIHPLAKLMAMKANVSTFEGQWDEAYAWNLRMHRMADHEYQEPSDIRLVLGMWLERFACDQLMVLLPRHLPEDVSRYLKQVAEGDELRCSWEARDRAGMLFTRDYLEAWYAWSASPETHPDFTSLAEVMLSNDVLPFFANPAASRPADVESFRRQLEEHSSLEREWRAYCDMIEASRNWFSLSFHEAWQTADGFDRRQCEIIKHAPILSMLIGGEASRPSQVRVLHETTRLRRTGLEAVAAILRFQHEQGELPRSLDVLVPKFLRSLPLDPFTGRPLTYRLTSGANGFVVYSWGSDHVDDGGKNAAGPRDRGDIVLFPVQIPSFTTRMRNESLFRPRPTERPSAPCLASSTASGHNRAHAVADVRLL